MLLFNPTKDKTDILNAALFEMTTKEWREKTQNYSYLWLIEFLGFWKKINNQSFKLVEFNQFWKRFIID